jgi:ComF family protein
MLGPVMDTGRALLRGLLDLVYPGVCPVCAEALPDAAGPCCAACRSILTTDPFPSCPRCAATIGPHTARPDGCSRCRGERLHFDGALRLGPHEGRLRDLILKMKYRGGDEAAEFLGQLWASHAEARLRAAGADLVIPVPLHWQRHWQRGHNQSEVLARALATRVKLPCPVRWLRRIRNTPKQAGNPLTFRQENVKGAFHAAVRPELRGRTVLLVDDVMATGSTCSEAARTLKAAGAAQVIAAVLSHGVG